MKRIRDKNYLSRTSVLLISAALILSTVVVTANTMGDQSLETMVAWSGYSPQTEATVSDEEVWIHFDDGVPYTGIGLVKGGTFEAAIRITPDELEWYDDWDLTVVKWYHYIKSGTGETHSGNIKIYEEGTSIKPGPLITSEAYTVTGAGWKEVPLSYSVLLDNSEDVWVSVEITHKAGEYPIGVDDGPAVDGKGDWIHFDDTWEEIQGAIDSNWDIWAKIEGEDRIPPVTTCILDGILEDGIYLSGVTITFEATDDLSGVAYTMYNLDNSGYETYVNPFVVSEDGFHTINFYSVDNAGNEERDKNCTFTIDCPLGINISGGMGINVILGNTGEKDITELECSISLDGGLVIFPSSGVINKTIDLPANDDARIHVFVFGFGMTTITVTTEYTTEASRRLLILFFVI